MQILDDQDVDGLTPLHLAVKSVETLGSTRPVRSLLIRGASRQVRDHKGQRPVDYALEFEPGVLRNELIGLLKEPKSCSCFMLKAPLKLMRKSPGTSLFFLGMLGGAFSILFIIVFPVYSGLGWPIAIGALGTLTFLFFLLSSLRDPGYLRKPKKASFS